MAFALLQRIASKTLDTLEGAAANAAAGVSDVVDNTLRNPVDTVKKVVDTGLRSNPSTRLFSSQGQNEVATAGKILQQTPDTTIDPPKVFKNTPIAPLFSNPVSDTISKIVTGSVGETARSAGRTMERVATPQGREKIVEGAVNLPRQTSDLFTGGIENIPKNAETIAANPAVEDALNLSTVASIGAGALVKNGAKRGTKELIESSVKATGKNAAGKPADTLLKEVAIEKPSVVTKTEELFTQQPFTPGGTSDEVTAATQRALQPGMKYTPKNAVQKTFDALVPSSKGVIGRSGDAGRQIVTLLNKAETEADLWAGDATARLQKAVKSLNNDEINTFADVAEGRMKPLSDVQANAVATWRQIADDVAMRAQNIGIDMGVRENYFPHQTIDLNDADKALMAQDMVSNGKFATVEEALNAINTDLASGIGREAQRRFGNLEKARLTDLPYNKSPNVLFDYIDNAYGRIADAGNFGLNDEVLYKLAQAAGSQGGDTAQVAKYVDQILGKNQGKNWSKPLTTLQTITKLNPATSVLNLTQNLSTWVRTDTASMAKSLRNVITNPELAFERAYRAKQISPNMAKQLSDYTGEGNAAGKWIRLIGMGKTEEFNRVMAVNAGYEYAAKLAKQAAQGSASAVRELARFGIKPQNISATGELTDDALIAIGREVSRATQFSTKAGELPYGWRTNAGKVATQFKSFAYKQPGFAANEVKRTASEAVKGNFKPFVNALTIAGVAAPIVGEIVNDFNSIVKNKSREDTDSLAERYVSNILAATSFGLLDSAGGLLGQYGESGIISAVGGPSASDAYGVTKAVADTASGIQNYDDTKTFDENVDPFNSTKRFFTKKIPYGVGQAAANTFIPNSYVDNLDVGGENLGVNESSKSASEPSLFGLFQGATDDKTLVKKYLDGKTYDAKSRKGQQEILNKLVDIADDEKLTPEMKNKIVKAAKVDPQELDYYRNASLPETDRLEGLLIYASQQDGSDREKFIQDLLIGKRSVAGKSLFSTQMYDRLYDEGLITKEEKALITAVKYDSVYNKFYMDRDYVAKMAGEGNDTEAKLRAYIGKVNTLFKKPIKTVQTEKKGNTKETEAPVAPKLKFEKLTNKSKKTTQWFSA